MELSASRLDLDMAGMLVANFLQSWLQAGLAQQPHPQQMRIERLDYQAQLAQRRYEEVDPCHRLVVATLEQRWNQALEEAQRLKDDYHNYRQQQGLEQTGKQKAELLALVEDLPRLWQAQTTSAKDRKRMLRLLIKDLTVEKRRAERKAILHIR